MIFYSFPESKNWILNSLFGPSRKYKNPTEFIPQKIVLNSILPRLKLGFIGNLMGMGKTAFGELSGVQKFLYDVDYLVTNLEGTLSDQQKVFTAQVHSIKTLSELASLFPPQGTVLSRANNHAGDFGWSEFNR